MFSRFGCSNPGCHMVAAVGADTNHIYVFPLQEFFQVGISGVPKFPLCLPRPLYCGTAYGNQLASLIRLNGRRMMRCDGSCTYYSKPKFFCIHFYMFLVDTFV